MAGRARDILIRFLGDSKSVTAESAQVAQSMDKVEASVKSADSAFGRFKQRSTSATDATAKGLKNVSAHADNSRSVVANMAGNATQDFAKMGGAAGNLGLAMGQFVEYAADGNIKMRNLAKTAGLVGGVAVAMWAVSKGAEQAAERTKQLTEYINDLKSASDEAILAGLDHALQNVLLNGGDFDKFFKDMAEGSLEGSRRFLELAESSGVAANITDALRAAILAQEQALRQTTSTTREYSDNIGDTSASTRLWAEENERATASLGALHSEVGDLEPDLGTLVRTTDRVAAASGIAATKADDLKQEFKPLSREAREVGDALAFVSAQYETLNSLISGERTFLELKQDFDDVQTAGEEAMQAVADGSMTAEEASRSQRLKVLELKQAVIDYAEEVGGIPPEVVSNILADIDDGSLTTAEEALDGLEVERTAKVNLDIRNAAAKIDSLSKKWYALLTSLNSSGGKGEKVLPKGIETVGAGQSATQGVPGFASGSAANWFAPGGGAEQDEIELARRKYERGELDLAQYRKILTDKQATLAKYSDEEENINSLLISLADEEAQARVEAEQKMQAEIDETNRKLRERDADRLEAAEDAADLVDATADQAQAQAEFNAALAEYNRLVKDPRAKPEDRAKALTDVADAQEKLDESTVAGAKAAAEAAGLDPNTVAYADFVRQALTDYAAAHGDPQGTLGRAAARFTPAAAGSFANNTGGLRAEDITDAIGRAQINLIIDGQAVQALTLAQQRQARGAT